MVYNRFRINVAIRVLLLAGSLSIFVYLLRQTTLYTTAGIVGILAVYQFYELLKYLDRTNRQLTRFLDSIRYQDYTQSFERTDGDPSFQALNTAFKEVMAKIQKSRADVESHRRYLKTVVQHVGIGLIAFKRNGDVELFNNAARRLLNIPHLKNITMMDAIDPTLVETLLTIKSGEKKLLKIHLPNKTLQLAIAATAFKQLGCKYTLISLQDIRNELEEKEMEAWQNLTRVLTHEIMNSVTPIASLSATVNDLLGEARRKTDDAVVDEDTIGDVHEALHSIQKRSEGLLHFVETYRNLTRIPKPSFEMFQIRDLFGRVQQLMAPKMTAENIRLQVHIDPENLNIMADPDLMEQVLINLLVNALQALHGTQDPQITLSAEVDSGGIVMIRVRDNGPGIPEDVLEKIFIPFFTTRSTGSGIGLSLSRQIVRLHSGTISVVSLPGEETVFTIRI